jgi:hypothetical protein
MILGFGNIKQLKRVSGVRRQTDNEYSVLSPQFSDIQVPHVGKMTIMDQDHCFYWFYYLNEVLKPLCENVQSDLT